MEIKDNNHEVKSDNEVSAVLRKYDNFDEQQFHNRYADEIEADLNRREQQSNNNNGTEENDSTREEQRHDRGNQVQSGQRTDDNSGSEGGKDSEGEVRTRDEGSDEQESSSEESAVVGLREQETDSDPTLVNVIRTLYQKGKDYASKIFNMKFFDFATTPDFMKHLGMTGSKFTIRYGVIARHFGKDGSHDFTQSEWEQIPHAIEHPFAVTQLKNKEKGFRIYTALKTEKGEYVVVGVNVKNAGRDMEVNAIATMFGRRSNANLPENEEVIYKSKEITPEQEALLSRPNSDQYPAERESSDGKGNNISDSVQENGGKSSETKQSKSTAEEKPFNAVIEMLRKKIPDASMEALTAADRLLREQALPGERQKAIEAVAKALGLKVEWRDTMEKENGTFNPKTRTITIARDSEHALANTFGHEVTHAVRNLSEADYKNLKDAVRRLYSSEKEYNEAVQAYGEVYTDLDFGALEEELIADNIGFMIGGRNDMTQELASRMNHRVLWAIHDAMNKVRNALAKVLHIDSKKNGLLEAIDSARATIRETMANAQRIAKEKGQGLSNESGSARQSLRTQDTAIRDALVERMRLSGMDVITDEAEGQRVLDMANGRDTRFEAARHKSEAARRRDEMLRAIDQAKAFISGKTEQQTRAERRERERKFREETKVLYDRVLAGNFDSVTLQLLDDFINKVTPNNYYGRPLSKRLSERTLRKVHERERTSSVDALFSRISESAVSADERTRPEAKRRIEEKKKELLKGWAIATGNWHTTVSDFTDDTKPIGSGKDSVVYHSKDGKSVIKVSKGKESARKFRPDMDNVALFNTVFPASKYEIIGYGEIDGKFVRFLRQPIVDFTDSTPLSVEERVAYMERLGFRPMNDEKTAFTNGEIVASDIQGNNIVKDRDGNIRVIDADMRFHTKEFGGKYSYPAVETDTETAPNIREQRVYYGNGANGVRFFRTANGEAYGFTVGGKIYIDPRIATSETPVHEYAHLWATALKSANAKEWQNVVGLMKGTKVWDEVKALYPELKSDDEIADEVLATYSGRRGAERLREEQRRIAKGNGNVFEKAEAISALESVKQALKRFWKGVADFLHIHYTSAEEVADRVMKDLLDGVDPRTFGDVEKGIRFQTSEELNNRFGSRWLDEQTNDDGRHTTQVKSTINSYKKFGDWVKRDSNGRDVDVLDASSGLGLGTAWMRDNGFKVDDVEPFPSDSREAPTFSSYDEIDKKYDYIISNAVLNVIPDDWRANVLHQMADKLKDGGKLVINVRGAEGIRKQGIEGKTRTTLDDASEILVHRPDGSIKSYQKGFTKSELKEWCEKELGEGYSVEIANNKNAGGSYDTAVVVTKNNESDIETINTKFNEELQQQIDGTLPEGHIYKMGKPGRILLSTGVPNLPIQMNAKRLQVKATLFDHDFDLSEVKDLVRVLQHPLAVFAYGDKSKAQNIIVPLQKDGKNFIVGLSLNPTVGGRKLEINSIRNVFPKDNSEWLNWINQDKALYIDKEKIQTLIDQQRTNLADVAYLDLDSVANVMENFENPKVSDENVADGGIMFRNGGAADAEKQSRRGTPNLYPDHIAQAIYEQSVSGFKFDLDEAWHDSLLSVKRLQEAISETRGVPIRDFENVYWHAVTLSSVNAAEMEQLMNLRIQPFIEAVQDICKKHDLTQEDIEVYLNCKHGLERNEAMARKFAKTKAEEEFKAELKKAQKTATANPNDQAAQLALLDVQLRMNDRKHELYLKNRERDYSGLTDIFDPKDKVTGDRLDLTVSELEDKAKKCVDDFENKVGVADVTKLWDNIHELNNYSLRKSYLSGLISKSQYDSVKQMYQWYVPLRGFNEEVAGDVYTYVTRGETRTQQLLKEAKGRTSRAGDILATMMNMANSAVNQGNRNLMKQKILNLALNAKSPLLSVSSTWYQTDANGFDVPIEPPINDQMTPSEQKDAIEQWEDTMEMLAKQGKVHRMSDNLRLNLRTQKWQADEHCIRVQRGGKEYCVWVNGNPRAAQALNDRLGNQVTKPYKATETILDKAEELFTDGFMKMYRYIDEKKSPSLYRGTPEPSWNHNNSRRAFLCCESSEN